MGSISARCDAVLEKNPSLPPVSLVVQGDKEHLARVIELLLGCAVQVGPSRRMHNHQPVLSVP